MRNHSLAFALLSMALPAAAPAATPYPHVYDPAFNGGIPLDDRFANVSSNDYNGQRLARAANGDVVVAGIVPAAGQSAGGNLGLVHYSSTGARIAWPNPTAAYASYLNIYLTYPNSTVTAWSSVADLKILGNYIYALVDYAVTATNSNVYVVVFRDDGTYIGQYLAFTTSLDEHGVGLAPYTYTESASTVSRLIAVANYTNGAGHSVVTLKRFSISAGALTVDTSFGPYGNGANDIVVPSGRCDAGAACDISASSLAAVATDTASPRLYASASAGNLYNGSGTDYVIAVIGIDGSNGGLLAGVGTATSGIYYSSTGSGNGPRPIAATSQGGVGSDLLYVADNYSFCAFLSCAYRTEFLKLRASAGLPPPSSGTLPDFNWGVGGEESLSLGTVAALSADADQVMAVGGELDTCSDGQGGLIPCGDGTSVALSVAKGVSEGVAFHQPVRSGGVWTLASWSDVIPGPTAGSYTVAGNLGGLPLDNSTQFGTSQLIPDPDGVFRSSFEIPDDDTGFF